MDFFIVWRLVAWNLHHRHCSAIVMWFDGLTKNDGEKYPMNKKGDQKSSAPDRLAGGTVLCKILSSRAFRFIDSDTVIML